MPQLLKYSLSNNMSIAIEGEDIRPGGGPVAVMDRFKDTGKGFRDVLSTLPLLLQDVKESVLNNVPSPSEVSVEFGAKVGGEVGLIISKGNAEANFKIKVTW